MTIRARTPEDVPNPGVQAVVSSVLCLGLCLAAQPPLSLQNGASLSVFVKANRTFLRMQHPAHPTASMPLDIDQTVSPGRIPSLKLVAQPNANTMILQDTYYSRPGSLSYCQAGQETFLRVIALNSKLRQTLRIKLQSCRDNIEPADPGVAWNPEASVLEIHWLKNSSAPGQRTSAKYEIANSGVVKQVAADQKPLPKSSLTNSPKTAHLNGTAAGREPTRQGKRAFVTKLGTLKYHFLSASSNTKPLSQEPQRPNMDSTPHPANPPITSFTN